MTTKTHVLKHDEDYIQKFKVNELCLYISPS